jgi:hypothetical protein
MLAVQYDGPVTNLLKNLGYHRHTASFNNKIVHKMWHELMLAQMQTRLIRKFGTNASAVANLTWAWQYQYIYFSHIVQCELLPSLLPTMAALTALQHKHCTKVLGNSFRPEFATFNEQGNNLSLSSDTEVLCRIIDLRGLDHLTILVD